MTAGLLQGRVAIVTGGAGGVGRATCLALAEAGARVVMTDIDPAALERASPGFDPAVLLTLRHDVASEQSWQEVFDRAEGHWETPSIIVNNAAIGPSADFEDQPLDEWRRVLQVNLDGPFLGTRIGVKRMKARGGAIVNVASIVVHVANPPYTAYAAAKAGVVAMSTSAAKYCAQRGYPVRVNSILPGLIETPLMETYRNDPALAESYDAMVDAIPMRRLARPAEIAAAILFLASDQCQYMNGSQMIVDGCLSA